MNRQEAVEKLRNRVKSLKHLIIRGYIIDELESRNEDAFDNCMLSNEIDLQDKPSKFFL